MKKIILSSLAVVAFLGVNAQKMVTETYPNGNKKAEGMLFGEVSSNTNESKEAMARRAAGQNKDGKWTYYYDNGTIQSEEMYDKGTMVGTWKTWNINGKLASEINFTTGKAVYFHANGAKQSEGTMKPGMITTGKWVGYFENGKKNYEGSYNEQGQKNGTWLWWDENGNATYEQKYENGNLISSTDLRKK